MKNSRTPWSWVPTLYFAEGIPYFIVNVISVTMFKRLGMPNGEVALYTSLLYLPWVIKPLWSPFVDVIRTKRWWILSMQVMMAVGFVLLAFSVPRGEYEGIGAFVWTLVIFYITALCSATHDIAADGFYMISLGTHEQSLFVGIRSTFYRIASVFGQGVIVVVAGLLEMKLGNIPQAWRLTLILCALLWGALTLWHTWALPSKEEMRQETDLKSVFKGFGQSFATFFRKDGVWLALLFMLLYRLPEAFSVKMLTPFLLDPASEGGLGLSTAQSGLVYGTVGVIALTLGGILGGVFSAHHGLKSSLWPMALSLALPCSVYLYMAAAQPDQMWVIYACVALDQFGYGFGFTAYMLYMMYFAEGEFKTSHYAICTAFMALSMMIPGLFAGHMQESMGYVGFFVVVMICCAATIAVTFLVRRRVPEGYGKKS